MKAQVTLNTAELNEAVDAWLRTYGMKLVGNVRVEAPETPDPPYAAPSGPTVRVDVEILGKGDPHR